MGRVGKLMGEEAELAVWAAWDAWATPLFLRYVWNKDFPTKDYVKAYTKLYLEREFRKMEYWSPDTLKYLTAHEKDDKFITWEEKMALVALKNAREPLRCPHCRKYVGKFKPNEVWVE